MAHPELLGASAEEGEDAVSGGSWNYFYAKLDEVADRLLETPVDRDGAHARNWALRRAFGLHLKECAKALHAIEWVDSNDWGTGDENEPIRRAVGLASGPLALNEAVAEAERVAGTLTKEIALARKELWGQAAPDPAVEQCWHHTAAGLEFGTLPAEAEPPADPKLAEQIRDAITADAVQERNGKILELERDLAARVSEQDELEKKLSDLAALLYEANDMLEACQPTDQAGFSGRERKRRELVAKIGRRLTPANATRGL